MKLIEFFLLTLLFSTLIKASPVLIWGAHNFTTMPALPPIAESNFTQMLAPVLQDHMIVVFLEQELSTTDFMCRDEVANRSCLQHLSEMESRVYYPNVQSPAIVLHSLSLPHKVKLTVVDKNGRMLPRLRCEEGKINLVTYQRKIFNRPKLLKSHDEIMKKISRYIRSRCPVIFMLTSMSEKKFLKNVSHGLALRLRRDSAPRINVKPAERSGTYLFTYPLHLFYSKVTLKEDGANPTELEFSSIILMNGQNVMNVKLVSNSTPVIFDLILRHGSYRIEYFKYNNKQFNVEHVEVTRSFSYYCGHLVGRSDTSTLTWMHFQFEIYFNVPHKSYRSKFKLGPRPATHPSPKPLRAPPREPFKFAPALHCVGFMTPALLMGIFVMIIILGGLTCGITCLMDVHGNDRYENPSVAGVSNYDK